MAILPYWLRVPTPRTFLYLMSLRTGAEMITLSMLFNKIAGFYGLLSILTGIKLNPTQLSMYIYSLVALGILAYLMPHIRKQSPMQCLALAYFYIFDMLINALYTAVFAITWFLTVSAAHDETHGSVPDGALGGGTINETAGFTSPEYNVSEVKVIPVAGGVVTVGTAAVASAASVDPSLQHGVKLAESLPSIFLIVLLTLVRIYFILIMMAYARQVLQHYTQGPTSAQHMHMDGAADNSDVNPFAPGSPQGQGWKGKMGRVMVSIGRSYWLGGAVDDGWTKEVNNRFRSPVVKSVGEQRGNLERERRARAGTGPPRPAPETLTGQK